MIFRPAPPSCCCRRRQSWRGVVFLFILSWFVTVYRQLMAPPDNMLCTAWAPAAVEQRPHRYRQPSLEIERWWRRCMWSTNDCQANLKRRTERTIRWANPQTFWHCTTVVNQLAVLVKHDILHHRIIVWLHHLRERDRSHRDSCQIKVQAMTHGHRCKTDQPLRINI